MRLLSAPPAAAGAAGAPTDANYVTTIAEAALSAEHVLSGGVILRGAAASKAASPDFPGQIYIETDGSRIVHLGNGSGGWNEIARGEAGIRLAQLAGRAHGDLSDAPANAHHNQAHPDTDHTDPPILKALGDAVGDLITFSADNTPARLAIGAALTHRLANVGGSLAWVPQFVVKTANETVNNSAALQNDDHLSLAVAANEIWAVRLVLLISSPSANSDFKCGWTAPAAATMSWGEASAGTSTGFQRQIAATTAPLLYGVGTTATAGSVNGLWGLIYEGVYTGGANAGTLQFQWAQNTATVEDTIVAKGSYMEVKRLI